MDNQKFTALEKYYKLHVYCAQIKTFQEQSSEMQHQPNKVKPNSENIQYPVSVALPQLNEPPPSLFSCAFTELQGSKTAQFTRY